LDSSKPDAQTRELIAGFRESLEGGTDWFPALLDAMAAWTLPEETHRGRRYKYFIGGEAFDWLLLAERLCEEVDGLVPREQVEDLLLTGSLPGKASPDLLRDRLGVDKHRGYLNYFYGVTVEEAMQLAAEREVQKRHISNGNQYQQDFSDEGFVRAYRLSRETLLGQFRDDAGYESKEEMSLTETKEFTYWLFKDRLHKSDGAKAASDTKKGLREYQRMVLAAQARVAAEGSTAQPTPVHT
jgi:hypothetical protein